MKYRGCGETINIQKMKQKTAKKKKKTYMSQWLSVESDSGPVLAKLSLDHTHLLLHPQVKEQPLILPSYEVLVQTGLKRGYLTHQQRCQGRRGGDRARKNTNQLQHSPSTPLLKHNHPLSAEQQSKTPASTVSINPLGAKRARCLIL